MTITGGQQLEEEWFAGRRAGGWVGGHQQRWLGHMPVPQGGKSRVWGGRVRTHCSTALTLHYEYD